MHLCTPVIHVHTPHIYTQHTSKHPTCYTLYYALKTTYILNRQPMGRGWLAPPRTRTPMIPPAGRAVWRTACRDRPRRHCGRWSRGRGGRISPPSRASTHPHLVLSLYTPFIHPLYTVIAAYAPMCTHDTCLYTIYTPLTTSNNLYTPSIHPKYTTARQVPCEEHP